MSQRVLELYRSLGDREERLSFFLMLCGDLGNSHGDSPVSRPLYDHVMSSLASAEGGIGQLVDMRADLLVSGWGRVGGVLLVSVGVGRGGVLVVGVVQR